MSESVGGSIYRPRTAEQYRDLRRTVVDTSNIFRANSQTSHCNRGNELGAAAKFEAVLEARNSGMSSRVSSLEKSMSNVRSKVRSC